MTIICESVIIIINPYSFVHKTAKLFRKIYLNNIETLYVNFICIPLYYIFYYDSAKQFVVASDGSLVLEGRTFRFQARKSDLHGADGTEIIVYSVNFNFFMLDQ